VWASNNSITSGTLGNLQQHHLSTVATDTESEDYFGALSFKIKADEANMTYTENRDTFTFIVQDVDANSSTKNNENNVFIMDYTGYMRANYSETGWNQQVGTVYNKGQWYTIGIILRKDGNYDCFIDGEKVSTTKYNKEWDINTTALKFLFNISNNGKYYIDELTWSKYVEDGFIAEANKVKTPNGGSISVYFSEPVADYDLNAIKVYECETDTEISGINAEFDNEMLTVSFAEEGMTAGKEHRIELNEIVGATGRTLATDNIYFNCDVDGREKTETVGADDFDDFNSSTATLPSPDTDYYQVNGWYLGHKWNSQTGSFVRPVSGDAGYATSMQIGNLGSDGGSAHIYMPIGKKMDSGVVTISFDFKPERVSNRWNDSWDDARTPNMVFMVYPDGIDDSDKSWAQGDSVSIGKTAYGRYAAGIFAHTIGASRFPGAGNNTDQRIALKELATDSTDANKVASTDSKWYSMQIEFNFDKGTTTYWLDGAETEGVSLATLDIDAIQGVSFGTFANSRDASTLIDNLKVEHTYVANIKTKTVGSESFDDLSTSGEAKREGYYYQPDGWYLSKLWASQTSSFFCPATDDEKGNVAKVGVNGSEGASANAYLPLGKINSGLVSISYDIKPVRAASKWNASFDHVGTPNFWVLVYPDGIAESDMTWSTNGASSSIGAYVGSSTSSTYPYGRPIAGIHAQTIAAPAKDLNSKTVLKTLTMDETDTNKVADSDSKWYNIKVDLDFDKDEITYYLDGVVAHTANLSTLDIDAIEGISFGSTSNARDAETLLDNVAITHTYNDNSSLGIMQVRFSDYYGKNYGTATKYSTVLDTVAVSFWSKNIDEASLDETTVRLYNLVTDEEIPYEGEYDSENGIYRMDLREYLSSDSIYVLLIDGVTTDGVAVEKYEQTIETDENGVVIVEPLYIWNGAEEAESGALVSGSTVTAGTRLINTTGTKKSYVFYMALYDDGMLKKLDFEEIEQDGFSTAEDKEANVSASFTLSEDDAKEITNIKAFLWDGMTTMKPVLPAINFTNTSAE